MKQLENRFIKVQYGSKIAEAVIEKLESLGLKHGVDFKPSEYIITSGGNSNYWWSSVNYAIVNDKKELTLDELFSIEEKPSFEVGKVYKDRYGRIFYCTEVRGEYLDGYGIGLHGNWCDEKLFYHTSNVESNGLKEASLDEWKEALIKEAKRRGFKEGVEFKGVVCGGIGLSESLSSYEYNSEEFGLYCNNNKGDATIYIGGKWAEIIENKLEINGYEAEKTGDGFKFGCALIGNTELKQLIDTTISWSVSSDNCTNHNRKIKSITLDSGVEITVEQLKQLNGNNR